MPHLTPQTTAVANTVECVIMLGMISLLPSYTTEQALLHDVDIVLTHIVNSQRLFFDKKDDTLFREAGEISALTAFLLRSIEIEKSAFELEHFLHYFLQMKSKVSEKIARSDKKNTVDSTELYLQKSELVILLNPIDQFILMSYFLGFSKKTDSNALTQHYERNIKSACHAVMQKIAAESIDRKNAQIALIQAKKQTESAERSKEAFLENMRHDIRTPLTGMIGFAHLIQQEAVNPKVKAYADDLVFATLALLDFQNNLLDTLKNRDQTVFENTTFDLHELIKKTVALIKPKSISKKINIDLTISENTPVTVKGDSKILFRVFLELLTNAVKFTHEGFVSIIVKAKPIFENDFILHYEIKDSGLGIPASEKENIFMKSYRLGASEGTGLGLSVVKQLLKTLRGKIIVDSVLGEGSTFIALIPMQETAEKIIKKEFFNERLHFFSPKILLIEDHPLTAKATSLMLLEIGCAVDIAKTAQSALQSMQKKPYDLVFLDKGLPDADGLTLAKKIQKQYPNTVICALTAQQEQNDFVKSGIAFSHQKPLLKPEAIALLNLALHNKKVIDFSLGAKRIGKDEAAAKSMITMLCDHLKKDQLQFKAALEKNNWATIQESNHRLLGALSYCGAPRLESACLSLQKSLKKASSENIIYHTQQVLNEIDHLLDLCR